MADNHVHEGHRERIKEIYRKNGFDAFSDINILEMLLFYSIPRKNTNEVAHELINTFGSISAVFDAPYEMLLKVKGITPNSATLITMVRNLFTVYEDRKTENQKIYYDNVDKVKEYCVSKFAGLTQEHFYALLFDSNLSLINCALVSKGTANVSSVDTRRIFELVISSNATGVIITHNHPSGFAAPSGEDINSTIHIKNALSNINVRLCDHIIVSGRDAFSMACTPKFKYIFSK